MCKLAKKIVNLLKLDLGRGWWEVGLGELVVGGPRHQGVVRLHQGGDPVHHLQAAAVQGAYI